MSSSTHSEDSAIVFVPYELAWPAQFRAEAQTLRRVLARWLVDEIEHIGSTAVPGLLAKPVIDIMAPVSSLQESKEAIAKVAMHGYLHYPYKPDVMHWFCKPSATFRTHHLHLVPFNSELWLARLRFRDALRQSSSLASEYAELKLRLAREFAHDREAYTSAKGPFVLKVLSENTAQSSGAA